MNPFNQAARWFAVTACFFWGLIGIAQLTGARINTSHSIPKGVYWMINKPIETGDYIIFCPPEQPIFKEARARGYIDIGFCPGGFGPMMKKVVAQTGDFVSSTPLGIFINQVHMPLSKPFTFDRDGLILHPWRRLGYTLKKSELLLMTDQSIFSFDARYFGVLTQNNHMSVIRPVFTFPSKSHFIG